MAFQLKQEDPGLLTIAEVARLLRLSVGAVRNLIKKKEIPALRLGKQYRIPAYVIDNLLAPLLGESPESLGFGLWKGRKETRDAVKYVNKIRAREESKSLEQVLRELREWEKTFSSTRTS
jgi:excisionase family DNA binding protein